MRRNGFKIFPLGGCGEIGMNMTGVCIDGLFYLIDCGVLFGHPGLIGVDSIYPDINFFIDQKITLTGWLITHGHEDHIGALPFLLSKLPAPVWTTAYTAEMIKAKFSEGNAASLDIRIWEPHKEFQLPGCSVTPFTVNHSIPAATGLFIETKYGSLLHTGDFRIDWNPPEGSLTHENIGRVVAGKEVTLMMADSTNALVPGTDKSESELVSEFVDIMATSPAAVVIASFASNIWRLQSILQACEKTGRKLYLIGRSLMRNYDISSRMGMMDRYDSLIIGDDELATIPKNKLVIMATGSQGEQHSGIYRIAYGSFNGFELTAADTVAFSARAIPGNERSISALMNQISRVGANIVTARNKLIHVSGHGFQEDLKLAIKAAKPKYFMPLHGELRFMKEHAKLAQSIGIPEENTLIVENGMVVNISSKGCKIVEKVQAGQIYVSQGVEIPADSDIFTERMALAISGLVLVSVVANKKNFQLVGSPEVLVKGVPLDGRQLSARLPHLFKSAVAQAKNRREYSDKALKEELRLLVRHWVDQKAGYKCYVLVILHWDKSGGQNMTTADHSPISEAASPQSPSPGNTRTPYSGNHQSRHPNSHHRHNPNSSHARSGAPQGGRRWSNQSNGNGNSNASQQPTKNGSAVFNPSKSHAPRRRSLLGVRRKGPSDST